MKKIIATGFILTSVTSILVGFTHGPDRHPASDQQNSKRAYKYSTAQSCQEMSSDFFSESLSALSGFLVGANQKNLFKSPTEKILRPFSSDGCSMSADGALGSEWVNCCVEHDTAYWIGGTKADKDQADLQLQQCMAQNNSPRIGRFYRFFVGRLGGPNSSQKFRWGYGWNYRRPYAPITPDEVEQVQHLYGADLSITLKNLAKNFVTLTWTCSKSDPVLKGFSQDEEEIYKFLNSNLKISDIIRWAKKVHDDSDVRQYEVQLEKCAKPMTFVVSTKDSQILQVENQCEE